MVRKEGRHNAVRRADLDLGEGTFMFISDYSVYLCDYRTMKGAHLHRVSHCEYRVDDGVQAQGM